MRYKLSPKNTVIVRGPADVTLLDGQATILGAPFTLGSRKAIASQKQLPIETENRAELEISIGKRGEVFEIQGSTIPGSWRLAAETLEEMREGKVVVIGPPDVGKSTLCVYLVNRLFEGGGQSVAVVDADIGQADMGPPTTIAHAVSSQPITSLQEMTPDRRLFIGHTTPAGVEHKLTRGIQRLTNVNERQLTIVNTDGWIADLGAILYKINLLTEINPNLVLGLAYSKELEPILGGVGFHSMRIGASEDFLERSRVDRRSIRAEGYRRFLEGATTHTIDLERARFSFPKLSGVELSDRRALKDLIVGILDKEGYLIEIGILTNFERDAATIYSRHAGEFRNIEAGHVKISKTGREMGFL